MSFKNPLTSLFKFCRNLAISIILHDKNIFPDEEVSAFGNHKSSKYASKFPISLILLNLLSPGRLIQRIRYKRLVIGGVSHSKSSTNLIVIPKPHEKIPGLVERTVDTLRIHGAAIVDGYFTAEKIDKILSKYKEYMPSKSTLNEEGVAYGQILPLDISNLWLDEFILDVTKNYIGRVPFAQDYPRIASYYPKKNQENSGFIDYWHMDWPCSFQATIFLHDISETDTRMEIVSGTNKIPFYAAGLSDNYLKRGKLNILPCVGSKGSIQFHCGNVFHKLHPVLNSSRTWLRLGFTSGPNVMFKPESLVDMLQTNMSLDNLSVRDRQILSGLFPRQLVHGYEPFRDGIRPSKKYKQAS